MTHEDTAGPDIADLLRRVEMGEGEATTQLWEQCFPRLLRYCRTKLPDRMRRVLDEEDVALSAFKSFCIGAEKGAFGDIEGRDELWKLLFTIAGRKAHGYVRHQSRQKRGGGQVGGESVFQSSDNPTNTNGINQIADPNSTPVSFDQFSHDCEVLLDRLDDDLLQTIAILRMEGYSVEEIAERSGCAQRSVERKLNLIRKIWRAET